MHHSPMFTGTGTGAVERVQVLLLLVLVAAGAVVAAPRPAQADSMATIRELLVQLSTASSAETRRQAAAALAAQGSAAVPALEDIKSFLQRERTSTEEERREVLAALKADVPTKDGRFRTPGRKEIVNSGDDFDWLGALLDLDSGLDSGLHSGLDSGLHSGPDSGPEPAMAGLGDVIADVAAIRALAASKDVAAALGILDFGFTEPGLIYRDECGRYLRKMAPYSLPALITASQNTDKDASLRRYANYQLDRMDRQNPHKALDHAGMDHHLQIAVLEAYGESKHREAVDALIALIDAPAPAVRKAARTALLAYVTGPPPPPAPKRKLTMTRGRLSEKEEPLWLTYRELAEEHLRRTYEDVLGDKPPGRATGEDMARALMNHHDQLRNAKEAARYEEAAALAREGTWAEASAAFDRLLAANPEHPQRPAMARAYFEYGVSLEKQRSWAQASAALSKAHGLAPDSEFATDALAGHYYALGNALQAAGKDGSAAFRQAMTIKPSYEPAREAHEAVTGAGASRWMLYAGLGGGAGALILLILGLAVRKRE